MTALEPQTLDPPRGVLRPDLPLGVFQHQRRLPSAALLGLVEHYWHVGWDLRGLPAQQQATLPHPSVHLVVEQGKVRVYGVHRGRFVRQLQGKDQVFGVKFRPGGFFPYYQRPVARLMDQVVDVEECFGAVGADLARQLVAATGFDELCALVDAFLQKLQPIEDPQAVHVNSLLAHIAQSRSIVAVGEVLEVSGLDLRGLQRLFQKYVGISPKWVIQRYRLHEAIAQVQSGKTLSWSALALELGYFDQAHLARDFRQMVGMAPGEYEKSLAPTYTVRHE